MALTDDDIVLWHRRIVRSKPLAVLRRCGSGTASHGSRGEPQSGGWHGLLAVATTDEREIAGIARQRLDVGPEIG